ncbi:LysM peptidoglycan-binding domain-containing protein [Variovorax paradoxus]|uniref:LysM peptidoglycan-binding domain-containing protein n=1 Tax=Variovorax paradoxus TaxID=34073 RepID=UPI0029C9A250|nr:LysM peptidoglycan-binding domain-containing protein [Variovorax paradoxus]
MVAIISGNNTGLNLSSWTALGANGRTGDPRQGNTGESVYVNVSNGNLVVQEEDALLVGLGPDIVSARTYNTQSLAGFTTNSNWQFGQAKSVHRSGGQIQRLDGDGSISYFAWDAASQSYRSLVAPGADTIVNSIRQNPDSTFTWTNNATGATETYQGGGKGLLLSSTDADAHTLTYTYDGDDRLLRVSDASGEAVNYSYSVNDQVTVSATLASGQVVSEVSYAYDNRKRLVSVSVNLNPYGDVPAGAESASSYVTRYGYDGSTTRISSITQSDGTSLSFTYVKANGIDKVASVTDGLGNTTRFAYNTAANTTTVTDPLGQSSVYTYDAKGQLTQVRSGVTAANSAGLSQVNYSYNSLGDVTSLTDGLGNTTTLQYDARDNLIGQVDAEGNTHTATYSAANQLLTDTRYAIAATGSQAAADPETTRYVYAAGRPTQLRFLIQPDGSVTEYRYNANGLRTAAIEYAADRYDLGALDQASVPSEAQMQSWQAAQDLTRSVRTDYGYDFRGQLQSSTSYADTAADGTGVAAAAATTQYIYDPNGLLRQTIAPNTSSVTQYVYDGLGRIVAVSGPSLDGSTPNLSLTSYDDTNNRATLTLANGLATTSTYDRAGRLISVAQASAATGALGQTRYFYDADGNLRMTQDPTGVRRWSLYDAKNRKVADIGAQGELTEYRYNANDQVAVTIAYATAVNTSLLTRADGTPAAVALAAIVPPASAQDQRSWNVYDKAGRLAWQVDAAGAVTRTRYDGASRVVSVSQLAATVNVAQLGQGGAGGFPSAAQLAALAAPDAAADRTVSTLYDLDGRVQAVIDGEGYLTEYRYNGAGALTQTIRYASAAPGFGDAAGFAAAVATARATNTLAALLPPASAGDIRTYNFYNAREQLVGQVDGEGYLTETVYDANGNVAQTLRYASPALLVPAPATAATLAQVRPDSSPQDQVVSRTWSAANQLLTRTDVDGTVTRYSYDSMGRLVQSTTALGTAEQRTLTQRYDVQGRLVGELDGNGSALLTGDQTAAQIDAIWATHGIAHNYDAAGRRTGSTDANGHRTLFFYDGEGRLTFTVNALGEVSENRYSALGQLVDTIDYGTRISLAGLTGANAGGLANTTLAAALNAVRNAALDSDIHYAYNATGTLASRTDALGHATSYSYNIFRQAIATSHTLAGGQIVTDTIGYDRRGLQTLGVQDAGALALTQRQTYDAFGRLIEHIDGNGNRSQVAYDRLGRIVATADALGGARHTTYDAFSRTLTQTDALGATTSYSHDTANRSVTLTTPEGVSLTTVRNRHGQTQSVTDGRGNTTSYSYDHSGNLLQTDAPLGASTSSTYDNAGLRLTSTDANGTVTSYAYDAANRLLTRSVDPAGLNLVTRYGYDAKGQAVSVTDPRGVVTAIEFDLAGQAVRRTVDPAGLNLATTYAYDTTGLVLSVTDPGGRVARYTYDGAGRRVMEQTDPAGLNLTTRYEYDANGNVTRVVDANGNASRHAYDALDRLVFTLDAEGRLTRQDYDAEGRMVRRTGYVLPIDISGLDDAPTPAQIEALAVASPGADAVDSRRYDRDGRLRFVADGTGAVVEYIHDPAGNVVETRAYAQRIDLAGWDLAGDPPVVPDAGADVRVRTVYDALDRAVWQVGATGAVTQYGYDANGNVTAARTYAAVLDGAALASWDGQHAPAVQADDSLDRNLRTIYDRANRAIWTADGAGGVVRHAYDGSGNVVRQIAYAATIGTAAAPDSIVAGALDRVTVMAYDGAGRRTYTVDALGGVSRTVYDASGNVSQRIGYDNAIAAPGATTAWSDADLAALVTANPAADRIQRYAWDAANRMVFAVDALGGVSESRYDGVGREIGTTRYARAIDASGLGAGASVADVRARLVPDASADRVAQRVFDAAGRQTYSIDASGYVSQSRYDALGRVLSTTLYALSIPTGTAGALPATADGVAAALVPAAQDRTQSQAYDAAGNVLASTDAMGFTQGWSYDAFGNRLSHTNAKGATWTYSYDRAGRMTEEVSPQVELSAVMAGADGRLQLDTAHSGPGSVVTRMSYNAFGDLAARTEAAGRPEQRTTRYEYDGVGRQIKVIYPPVGVYDAGADDATTNGDGIGDGGVATRVDTVQQLFTETTYDGLGNAVANRDVAGHRSYKTYDLLGRATHEVDALGQVTGYARNTFGDVTALTRYAGATPLAAGQPASLDPAQLAASVSALAGNADRTVETSYDRLGRAIEVREPEGFTFDAGQPAGSQYASGRKTTRNTYDSFGGLVRQAQLQGPGNWVLSAHYFDRRGQKTASVDALGYLTRESFDAAGNVVDHVEHARAIEGWAGTGSLAGWTGAADAAEPAPAAPVDADDRRTVYTYDGNNRKVGETRKNVEFSTASDGSSARGDLTTTHGYDAVGNLTSTVDAKGGETLSYFDALGRVTAVAEPTRTSTETGAAITPLTVFRRDAHGNVVLKTEYVNGAGANGMPAAPSGALPPLVSIPNPQIDAFHAGGYISVNDIGYISATPFPGSVAVHQLHATLPQFVVVKKYVTEPELAGHLVPVGFAPLWADDGIIGYIAAEQAEGTVPLYRMREVPPPGWVGSEYTQLVSDPAVVSQLLASGEWTQEAPIGYVASAPAGSLDTALHHMQLIYFGSTRDVYGMENHVYAPATIQAAPDPERDVDLYARLDRTSYAQYDALGHVVQTTDAAGVNHNSSYNAQGLAAKEWQSVTGNDGARRTLWRAYAYDALGRQTHVYDPGTSTDGANYVDGGATGLYSANPQASVTPGSNDGGIQFPTPDNGKLTLAQLANIIDPSSTGFAVEFDYITPSTVIPGDEDSGETVEPGHPGSFTGTYPIAHLNSASSLDFVPDEAIGNVSQIRIYQLSGSTRVLKWQGSVEQANGAVSLGGGVGQPSAAGVRVDTAMQYNAFGELVSRSVNGQAGEYFDYDTAGRLWRTNVGGVDTVALYDLLGRQTAQIANAGVGRGDLDLGGFASAQEVAALSDVRRTDTSYDLLGRVVTQALPERLDDMAGGIWLRPVVHQSVDRWGNVVAMSDPRAAAWVTHYRYNASNQLVTQIQTDADGNAGVDAAGNPANPNAAVTRLYYDALGRQVAVRDALGRVNGQAWDAGGNLVSELHADGGVITHAYSAFSEKVRSIDAEQRTTVYHHDLLGRLVQTRRGSGAEAIAENQRFDEAGRLRSQTNGAGERILYERDLRGNLIRTTQLSRTTPGEALVTVAGYDALNRKTIELDANGALATWRYDYFGALTGHMDIGGASYGYAYDNARQLIHQTSTRGQNQAFHYDAAGQLVRIDDAGVGKTSSYVYDLSGRHLRETTVQGGITYQDNRIAYDALGRMRWVEASGLTVNIDYDLAGNRTHVARQVNTGTGTESLVQTSQENYAYDAMNRQTTVQTLYGASNVPAVNQTHTLTYDHSGNRTSDTSTVAHAAWVDGAWTPMAEGQAQTTETYAYDSLGRLSSTHRDGVLVDARRYDGASRALSAGAVLGTGGLSYEYALAHNLATGELLQYRHSSYDGLGRLDQQNLIEFSRLFAPAPGASSTITRYAYDAVGNVRESTSVTLDGSGTPSQGKTINAYERAEGYRLANSLTGSASAGGTSQGGLGYHYDANGHLSGVSNPGQMATVNPELTQHRYVNDAQGRVLYSDYTLGDPEAAQHAQRQLIVNGEVLGRYGQAVDLRYRQNYTGDPAVLPAIYTGAVDLSLGYQPIAANYPANAPGSYSVGTGDTLQGIAKASYGDGRLWYLIADANGLSSNADLQPGQVLRIPAVVTSANSADTFRPYDPSKIASDSPAMMAMPRSQDGGCGAVGQIIMVVVAIVVTIYTAGAAAGSWGAVGTAGTATASTGIGATMTTGLTALGGGYGAVGVAAAAVGGAVGSIASQTVGVAIGAQDSFSWKGVALGAIGAGVGAGLGAAGVAASVQNFTGSALAGRVASAALGSTITQGIAVATGLQPSFSWRSVAASAVSAGASYGLNSAMDYYPGQPGVQFDLGKSLVTGIGGSLVGQAVRGGKISAATLASDAFGNVLGDSLAAANSSSGSKSGPIGANEPNTSMNTLLDGSTISDAEALRRNSLFWQSAYAANGVLDPSQPVVMSDAGEGGRATAVPADVAPWERVDDGEGGNSYQRSYQSDSGASGRLPTITVEARDTPPPAYIDWSFLTTSRAAQQAKIDQAPAPIGTLTPIGPVEGFFTFNPGGRFAKGVAGAAYDAWTALPKAVIGVGKLAADAVGYADNALFPQRSMLTGETIPYQPNSGLVQSIQRNGVAGTIGGGIVDTVRSAPGIGLVGALYAPSRDWGNVGAQAFNTGAAGAGGAAGVRTAGAPAGFDSLVNQSSRASQTRGINYFKDGGLRAQMNRSSAGQRVLAAADSGEIELVFSAQDAPRGQQGRSYGNRAVVFLQNTQNGHTYDLLGTKLNGYEFTAGVGIHEGLHALGVGGSRRAEALVRLAELDNVGVPIDRRAMRQVLTDMGSNYDQFRWRSGGSTSIFPGLEF